MSLWARWGGTVGAPGILGGMAERSTTPEKRPGFFSQIKTLFTFTKDVFPWVPWALIGIIVLGIGLGVLLGFLIPPVQVWSIIIWGVTGLLFGILGAMMLLTRTATKAMYRKIDGMPGASGHVLSTGLGRSWTADEQPVQVNAKTQEGVYRAVGKGGIVLVAEGQPARVARLIKDERMKASRVASGVPVTVIHVGHGEDEVSIENLAKEIKRLPKKIDRATRVAVIQRFGSIGSGLSSLPIPKGVDPMRVRSQRPR